MPKKAKSVSNQQCGDCVHHWACATWNVGSIASMDGTNCANFERFDVKAVPVVRCKECKHNGTWQCHMEYDEYHPEADIHHEMHGDDDFCSYGKRKDGVE